MGLDRNTTPNSTERQKALTIDVDYYQSIIDDPQVSEARKRELIEIIGALVVQFIDIGFGIHPVQLAQAYKQECLKKETKAKEEKRPERMDV